MRAVEDLVNAVRDHESRRYLKEAIDSYQVGAFRSAIVATWIAVAFDLIGKIRQLSDGGDGGARDFIRGLENAINAGNMVQLQQVERDLLTISHEKFEIIDTRELAELGRLRDDRHVCAHPAFVRPTEIFVPTPELVRSHLATATDAVLSKGPTPGKRAMKRFQDEIIQASFPESLDELVPYLRDRYFEPGKSSLRRGLAELIIKGCMATKDTDGTDLDPRIARRCALSAHALERIQPALLSEALSAVVTKREEGPGLSEDELLLFTGSLGDMAPAWQALQSASHARVREVLKNVPVQRLVEHRVFACGLAGEAKDIVEGRLVELDSGQLAVVIGQSPDLRYVQAAIEALREAPGHAEAKQHMATLVLPLSPVMTAGQVREVLACFRENTQVRMAYEMPPLLVTFFERTERVFAECYEDWYELVDWLVDMAPRRDPTDYYAYPELWARVHSPDAARL
jgi:hypothetical protein